MSTLLQNKQYDYKKFLDDSLAQAQRTAAVQQQALHQQYLNQSLGTGLTGVTSTNFTMNTTMTTTGPPDYQEEYEVSRIVKRAKGGYFYVISVDATDDVHYRVWKGGMFPYVVAKMFKYFAPDIDGNKSTWHSVTKRSHLPATIGSAYDRIDTAIKADIEDREHDVYIKDLLKTPADNLKMIGGLEKLQEGDVDAEDDPNTGSSHNVGGYTYSNNLAVSGSPNISIGSTPGQTLSFDLDTTPGNILANGIEATKITLNGTDLEGKIQKDIAAAVEEKLKALELAHKVEDSKAP